MIECDRQIHRLFAAVFAENWHAAHIYIAEVFALIDSIISDGIRTGGFTVSNPALAAQIVASSVILFIHPALMMDAAPRYSEVISDPATQTRQVLAYLRSGE